ncbi:MAG: SDR family oxidoreductase, partial [Eubacterium sp.]
MGEPLKVVIVGSGPIGIAIAKRMKADYAVELIDNQTCQNIDKQIQWSVANLGGIDILINAIEHYQTGAILEISAKSIEEAFRIRVSTLLKTIQTAAPLMEKNENGGRILNLAGERGNLATGEHAIEATIAAAIAALTREIAVDLESRKIAVNSISPWMLSPEEIETFDALRKQRFTETTLMDRLITPDDIAILAEFLVSSDAFTVDAYDMVVDGGMSAFRVRMEESW